MPSQAVPHSPPGPLGTLLLAAAVGARAAMGSAGGDSFISGEKTRDRKEVGGEVVEGNKCNTILSSKCGFMPKATV